MPATFQQSIVRPGFIARVLAIGLLLLASRANAQLTITSIVTSTNTTTGNSTETGINPTTLTYQNDIRSVTTLTAGGNTYGIQSTATDAFVRRNTTAGNLNNSYTWSQNAGASTVVGTDTENFAAHLLDNNIFQGGINVFANGTSATAWQSNIERVDFVWSAGISVLAADGFAVFDLNGTQEPFQIALITSLGSGLANPLTWTFSNPLTVAAINYGSALDLDNNGSSDSFTFNVLRFSSGDTMTSHNNANSTYTQSLDGTFIRMSDLGISSTTTIFGYAIMATDVADTAAQLVDWNNTGNYLTNTSTATGGIDLASFNGRLGRIVPEPATYGALLIGAVAAMLGLRRRNLVPIRVTP